MFITANTKEHNSKLSAHTTVQKQCMLIEKTEGQIQKCCCCSFFSIFCFTCSCPTMYKCHQNHLVLYSEARHCFLKLLGGPGKWEICFSKCKVCLLYSNTIAPPSGHVVGIFPTYLPSLRVSCYGF